MSFSRGVLRAAKWFLIPSLNTKADLNDIGASTDERDLSNYLLLIVWFNEVVHCRT